MEQNQSRQYILVGIAGLLLIVVALRFLWPTDALSDAASRLASGPTQQRLEAIHDLEMIGSDEAANIIAQYLDDSDRQVAQRAMYALGRMKRTEFTDTFKEKLNDPDPDVRIGVLRAISYMPDPDPQIFVTALRNDPSEDVKAAAARMVAQMQMWAGMEPLVENLRHPSLKVRGAASAAVKHILGVDFGFKATDPPALRREALARIERDWRRLEEGHRDYMKRREEIPWNKR